MNKENFPRLVSIHRTSAARPGLLLCLSVVLFASGSLAALEFQRPDPKLQPDLFVWSDTCNVYGASYVRGYPVFDSTGQDRDSISTPTPVPLISQVTPHLYKLSHKTQGKNFAIIISDNGHGLILDCGLFPETMLEEIIVGLRTHMGLKEIDAFWISHMHGDHFLLGPMLKEKYGAKAWTLDRIVDKCEHPRRYDYAALVEACGDGFDGMKIDKGFRDGESIDWEGYKIQLNIIRTCCPTKTTNICSIPLGFPRTPIESTSARRMCRRSP